MVQSPLPEQDMKDLSGCIGAVIVTGFTISVTIVFVKIVQWLWTALVFILSTGN
jgi:hypothetical protein